MKDKKDSCLGLILPLLDGGAFELPLLLFGFSFSTGRISVELGKLQGHYLYTGIIEQVNQECALIQEAFGKQAVPFPK